MTDTTTVPATPPLTPPRAVGHRIRPATVDDSSAAADVLARAFFDDPVFRWCLPDPNRRSHVLPPFFRLAGAAVFPHGESQLAEEGLGAALWVPPGRAAVADEEGPAFEAALGDLLGRDAERTFALMAMLDEHHPAAPNRFLWFLGVGPEAQGRGLGSTLLRDVLVRCDQDGTAAYLDATSEGSRRLYERHGFTVLAERSTAGSPPLWAMWREPGPAAQPDARPTAVGVVHSTGASGA